MSEVVAQVASVSASPTGSQVAPAPAPASVPTPASSPLSAAHPSMPPAVPRVDGYRLDAYLRPEMEEALGIWVAKGERLAERKRNVVKEVEILMKELEGLRVLEELMEERKNMIRGWMELPELPE